MAERSVLEPQQHKQPSRKGKRAWRKNVDITEIQSGLEEAREEVTKGGVLSERPSDSLFTLDTTGSSIIQTSYNKAHKPLKADEILAQRSTIPSIESHKRPIGVTDGVIEHPSKKRKANGVSQKEYERLRQVAFAHKSLTNVIETNGAPSYDPWTIQPNASQQDERFSYLEKPREVQPPPTLRQEPICLVAGAKEVPSISKPRPGTSYNPAFDDWEELLDAEGSKEVEAERRRLHEAQLEKERLDRIAAAGQEKEREEGMQTEDESAWEGFESDYEKPEWLKKKRPERKTPQERKKALKKKEKERAEKAVKKQKDAERQNKQFMETKNRILKSKIEGNNAIIPVANNNDQDSDALDDTVLRRRRLGKDAIPEAPLELVLPDELQESLRLLKPEGNLLKDRFRNVLVRGKLESRRPIQQPKKKRRNLTEKWAYKDFRIGV